MDFRQEDRELASDIDATAVSNVMKEANHHLMAGAHLCFGNSPRITLLIRTALADTKADAIQRALLSALLHRLEGGCPSGVATRCSRACSLRHGHSPTSMTAPATTGISPSTTVTTLASMWL